MSETPNEVLDRQFQAKFSLIEESFEKEVAAARIALRLSAEAEFYTKYIVDVQRDIEKADNVFKLLEASKAYWTLIERYIKLLEEVKEFSNELVEAQVNDR